MKSASGLAACIVGRSGQRPAHAVSVSSASSVSRAASNHSPHGSSTPFQVIHTIHAHARKTLQISCPPIGSASRGLLGSAFIVLAAAFVSMNAAHAQVSTATRDGTPQVDASIANKNWAEALRQLDARSASNPNDVQAKFKRATVLARLNRDDDAIIAFTELTQRYPELPEPYNNLAALYARKGRYEDARNALETTIKANPGYALAYDNLGDLYLRLASESYKRAQTLGSTNPVSRQRIADIQKVISPPQVNRKLQGAASGTAARAPRAASASGEWSPVNGDSTQSVPNPDSYAPFGGSTGSLPTQPYTAPKIQQ
ncbi:TPR repeat [Candidatus Burkholderia pumila]|uniref:TPR repeat n=1 Tax=Candidatus Burkholderia pumila TaxID=1090375 RepID=A0ABR5HLK9_9BURK|nr:TPR repeat [Candidatus Burkholderia pumila]